MLKLINFYQKYPHPPRCRYSPSCSEYAKQSYERFNFFYATFLTVKRILKCNPLFKGGYDPVPEKKTPLEKQKKF